MCSDFIFDGGHFILQRGKGAEVWGWGTAYGKKERKQEQNQERAREGTKS